MEQTERLKQISKEYFAMPLQKLADEQTILTCNVLAHSCELTFEALGLSGNRRNKKQLDSSTPRAIIMNSYLQRLEIIEQVGEERGRELMKNYST